nr:MAG TPA: Spherulation-specific family 4 [Caudoviricetes sp.]
MQSADSALGTRIDSLASTVTAASSKADASVTREDLAAYPTSATVAETYATKASLGDYLPKTEAAGVYATKSELANAQLSGKGEAPDLSHLATKAEMASADGALGQRIDQVKATADAAAPMSALAPYLTSADAQTTYATKAEVASAKETADAALPAATASTTYATKAEVDEVRQKAQRAPQASPAPAVDLSPYAKTADVTSADEALGKRIDQVSAVASAAAPSSALSDYATSAAVAGTYATKEALADYLKAADASDTYATKAQLAQAQIGGAQNAPDLSGLATKAEMRQADSALGARINEAKATAEAALTPAAASSTYATKEDVSSADTTIRQRIDAVSSKADAALPSAEAASTYATQASLAEVRTTAEAALPKAEADGKYAAKADLAKYATTDSLNALTSTYASAEALTEATKPLAKLSVLPDKVSSLETAVQSKADSSALSAYLTSEAASSAYAPKESISDLLPKADAATTYATKDEVAAVRAAIPGAQDLSGYLTTEAATSTYATKADVEGVRSAIPAAPDLSAYLTTDAASKAYATKADLAQAQAGGKVDLSGYVTAADADGKYATKEALSTTDAKVSEASAKAATAVQPDALSAYATAEALAKVKQAAEAAAEAVAPPFRSGERYSSPVTYYWPDYYNESKGTSKWAKALKAAGTLGIVILNKDSGNWDEKNEDFGKQAAQALAAGARRAVFYVKTQYGVASLPADDPARNGVPNPDKYTKEYILGQIAKFTEQYGDVAQGVFLDETINGWGAQAGRVQWYKDLIAAIREQYGQNFYIVVNAGSNMSPEMCALDFDTAMMFEQDAGKFLNEDQNAPVLPDHMRSYPSEKWWAVIHGVTKDNYRQVFEKLDTLPIGHAYITDGVLVEDPNRGGQWEPVGNPYANPPSEQLIRLTSSWIRGTLGLHLEVEDLKAQVEALKKAAPAAGAGAGQAGKLLVLGPNDPLPQGVTDDTVIVRREA